MELEKFFIDFDILDPIGSDTQDERELREESKGLYIVGTCYAHCPCEFLDVPSVCRNVDSPERGNLKGPEETCIHWEKKK